MRNPGESRARVRRMLSAFGIALVAWGSVAAATAAAPDARPKNRPGLTFEKDIRPLFERRCGACHFPGAEVMEGDLDLSTLATSLAGGFSGGAIKPGNAEESLLVRLIEGRDDPVMPPKDFKGFTKGEIARIRKWIDAGAAGGLAAASSAAAPAKRQTQMKRPESDGGAGTKAETDTTAPSKSALPAPVASAAFSPDGVLLAEGGMHEVRVSRVGADGVPSLEFTLPGHSALVRALAFSPDGRRLAAAGGKPARAGEIIVWDLESRSQLVLIEGHTDNILDVAFSPDGSLLATCSYDRLAKIWNAETGAELHSLKGHVDAVFDLDFSPDGARLATAAGDRTVKLWDVKSGARLLTLSDSTGALAAVAFSPDGSVVAAGGADRMIRVWSAAAGALSQSSITGADLLRSAFAHDAPILSLRWSPDGGRIITTSEDRTVRVRDAQSLLEVLTLEPQRDWVTALALDPAGTRLAVGRYDGTSALYDAAKGDRLFSSVAEESPGAPSGRKKITSLDVDNVIINARVPASLQSISPSRVHRGWKGEFRIRGTSLDDAEMFVTWGGFKPELKENRKLDPPKLTRPPEATGAFVIDNAHPHEILVAMEIPDDTPLGGHFFMFRNATGMANPVMFTVAPRPDIGEKENNDDAEKAHAITELPAAVGGNIASIGDADLYRVHASAGQEIVVALRDAGISAPRLRILSADGRELAASADFPGGDIREVNAGVRAPADGDLLIEVTDATLGTGGYRLHVGEFPYVHEAFPPGVPAGGPQSVGVKGFNIGGTAEMTVDPPDSAGYAQTMTLPLPGFEGNPIPARRIAVGGSAEVTEAEPNDSPATATIVPVPGAANGRMGSGGDSDAGDAADWFRFRAEKGERLILETMAARLDSPLDPVIEILTSEGERIKRATVRCVAETKLTLRDHDSRAGNIRIENWTDFRINDFAMVGSEILRVRAIPDYADEDIILESWPTGQRRGWFGTTPEFHAIDSSFFKVEVHPPGTTFPPNGLPLHDIYWINDDHEIEGSRPGEARLDFVAPAAGEYTVRVTDANGASGPAHVYRLMIRRPEPDFDIVVSPYRPNVPLGGAAPITVRARRRDGYNMPIRVAFDSLPEGYSCEGDVIPAGEDEAILSLRAEPGATGTGFATHHKLVASAPRPGPADPGGDPLPEVTREAHIGEISTVHDPDLEVRTDVTRIEIAPGGTGRMTVSLGRNNGFTSRVPIDVLNLPFGVYVLDTGLNGILVREFETDRPIEIYAEPWVEPVTRKIHVQAQIETRSTRPLFLGPPVELIVTGAAGDSGS